MRFLRPSLLFGTSLLIACGGLNEQVGNENYQPSPSSPPPQSEVGSTSQAISSVVAEGTAVSHALRMKIVDVTRARNSHTGTLQAVDLAGKPSFHLVFISEDPGIASPWAFAAARAADLTSNEAGSMAMVGATEEQSEVGMTSETLSLLGEMHDTLRALGGLEALDAIVSPAAGVVLLRDKAGLHWDVSNQEALSPEEFEQHAREYVRVLAEDEDGERAAARAAWRKRQEGRSFEIEGVTREGHLDIAKALDAAGFADAVTQSPLRTPLEVEQQGAIKQTEENCTRRWFFGWHTSCDDVEEGWHKSPTSTQLHYPRQPRKFTVGYCATAGVTKDTNAYVGCGPAAVTSWVWRAWKGGETFSTLAGHDRKVLSESYLTRTTSAEYEAFTRLIGAELIDEMGTCSWGNSGSMTMAGNLVRGANRWLGKQGTSLRMKRAGNRKDKAKALHNNLGLNEKPMIGGFDLGFASAHWSPIHSYRVVQDGDILGPKIYIKTLDYQDRWYEVFGVKLLKEIVWFE